MQSVLLKASGLATFPNQLSSVPQGSLLEATNVVINREGIIEPRRGYKIFGNAMGTSLSNDYAHQLFVYKNRILRHFGGITGGTTVEFDNGTTLSGVEQFTAFSGTFSETQIGLRIKGVEANGNFYFTTSKGIKKISASSASDFPSISVTDSGGIKALDVQLELDPQIGFFEAESVVAYRVVWGIKDKNNNLILGSPSGRAIIYNPLNLLLNKSFNNLLVLLDTENNSNGISAQNYVSSLKVNSNSDPFTLRTNLIGLATKLDNDTVITKSTIDTASGSVSLNVASLVFNSDISTELKVGDQVVISALSGVGTTQDFNGTRTITAITTTSVANDTIKFSLTHADFGSTADTGGSVKRLKYTLITQPVALDSAPTTAELQSLATYYDAIVTDLQTELTGIIANPNIFNSSNSVQSATVDITTTIPQGITTQYFYQIYRTPLTISTGTTVLTTLDPGDEEGLVYEANPTSQDLTNGYVTVHDIVPESFIGANLYTNPISGEGIAQANEVPPLSKDIQLYKGYTFYSNTQTKQSQQLNLLSISNLISGTSTLTITDGITSNIYTFVSPLPEITKVTTVADVAGSLNNKYFNIYSANNKTAYYVWYNVNSAGIDPLIANKTGIQVALNTNDSANTVATKTSTAINNFNDFTATSSTNNVTVTNSTSGVTTHASNGGASPGFTFTIQQSGQGEDAPNKKVLLSNLSTPAQQVNETANSLVRVINKQASGLIYAFYLSGPTDVPGLMLFQSRQLGTSPFYLNVNSTATGNQFSPAIPTSGTSVISTNDISPNRLYFSKFQQPEAVPLLNFIDIGPKDRQIIRILALRDSLFIIKEEAVYRLSGDISQNFVVALFDGSTNIVAPDSAVVLNNLIYMYTNQGITTVSDTGISIISRPIENLILDITIPSYTNFSTATFGVPYETDRSYYLWTVTNTTDTKATQCFKYNTFTNSWTIYNNTKTSGIVNKVDDLLYLGAGDVNFIEQERKSFTRTDHADRDFNLTIASGSITNNIIKLPSLNKITVGDVIYQLQYLTIIQFNRLLMKLDLDPGIQIKTFFSTLQAVAGDDLRVKLTNLATKLDADPGTNTKTYSSSITGFTSSFPDQQSAFNVIIASLNTDTGLHFRNYLSSTGTTEQETIIISLDVKHISISTLYQYPFIAGSITIFNHINTTIQWSPQFFQDPSLLKHVRESTIVFESNTFTNANVFYSSDLSANFDEIPVLGAGNGTFGNAVYGNSTFGGSGTSTPYRTLIPANKQRCRYINTKFIHGIARENFAIYGLSFTFEASSTRAYR